MSQDLSFSPYLYEQHFFNNSLPFQNLSHMSATPNPFEDEQHGSFELSCHSPSNGSAYRSQTSQMSMLGYFDVLTLTPAGNLLERLRKTN